MSEIEVLKKLLRTSTFARLQRYLRKNDLLLEENVPELAEGVYNEQISIIMLWGMLGAINLKTHFNLEIAKGLTALGQNTPVAEVSEKMAQEFMKEFSNNQAGFLKGTLENHKVMMGMSLPFIADGKDEVIFRKIRDPRAQVDVWKIKVDKFVITFTAEICLLDSKSIQAVHSQLEQEIKNNMQPQNLEDDGEINFL